VWLQALISVVDRELLERHTQAILEKGFAQLMAAHRLPDLKRMHTLFARVDRLDLMKAALSDYIKKTGKDLIMDEEKDADMVRAMLYNRRIDVHAWIQRNTHTMLQPQDRER
jgi:cullin-4